MPEPSSAKIWLAQNSPRLSKIIFSFNISYSLFHVAFDRYYNEINLNLTKPSQFQLSLVSLALMETLIDLNCEDVMVDLVFKHLLNGHHLAVSYRHRIADPEPYRDAAIAYLALSPRCCSRPMEMVRSRLVYFNYFTCSSFFNCYSIKCCLVLGLHSLSSSMFLYSSSQVVGNDE